MACMCKKELVEQQGNIKVYRTVEVCDECKAMLAEQAVAAELANRKSAILSELDALDRKSIRPLRAKANGTATQQDEDLLAAQDARAVELRAELAALSA